MIPATTTAICAYHHDRNAADTCVECGKAICEECRTTVADKSVCRPCVENIRSRVAAEMNAPSSGGMTAAPPQQGNVVPTPAPSDAPGAGAVAAMRAVPEEPLRLSRLLVGLALGLVVGLIGALIYDKFVFYTNIQFGLVASFIGFAVGFAVLMGVGRGGLVPALLGGALALLAMVISQYLLFNDVLARELGKNGDLARQFAERGIADGRLPFTPRALWFVVSHLDFMDWVFIAIGVYGGFTTP